MRQALAVRLRRLPAGTGPQGGRQVKPYRKVMVAAFECWCLRCGHIWTAFTLPTRCAKCKARGWQTERGTVPLGRRPKRGPP